MLTYRKEQYIANLLFGLRLLRQRQILKSFLPTTPYNIGDKEKKTIPSDGSMKRTNMVYSLSELLVETMWNMWIVRFTCIILQIAHRNHVKHITFWPCRSTCLTMHIWWYFISPGLNARVDSASGIWQAAWHVFRKQILETLTDSWTILFCWDTLNSCVPWIHVTVEELLFCMLLIIFYVTFYLLRNRL